MSQNRTWPLPGLWAAGAVLLLSSCGTRPASSPNPTQPLDERRARDLIARALRDEAAEPELGRSISVGRGLSLAVDIGVAGKTLGIAYVTESERANLGALIPAHDVGSQALRVVRDQEDSETVILLLHDTAYLADDQAGSDHEVTGVMAARKLQRDVKDFLVQARAQRWR
ncbi:MAG: hypothetical protein RJA70_825 [Pseudomonadota bacterium]